MKPCLFLAESAMNTDLRHPGKPLPSNGVLTRSTSRSSVDGVAWCFISHGDDDEVSSIQAILIDAEEQQGSSNLVRDWIKGLKKVFFEADDLLDDAIRRDLDVIAKDKASLNLVERRQQPLLREPYSVQLNLDRETYLFVTEGEVIGRSYDKKKIVDFLLDSEVEENVVSYQLFVLGDNVFEVKMIAEKIVESGGGKKDNYLQLDTVQNELRKMLDGKKYLLVLDDMWNEDPLK
ncbi:hypothetical protein T459_07297 [Capsicum annuum]|uniref:Disease resistance N-terminal domain-containing protein n=1 Tax=Capsicum annuum TaxID=4072 RepID=A0A2G2ZTC4_CAPAN|nr:hypothetical protein T459_07297 [Capsicum annuum]